MSSTCTRIKWQGGFARRTATDIIIAITIGVIATVTVDYIFEPSRFLSGDLWGLIEIDDDQLGVWICDYSGKGIQAALNTFRIHTLVQEYKNLANTPSKIPT